jgi:hypothetical protein
MSELGKAPLGISERAVVPELALLILHRPLRQPKRMTNFGVRVCSRPRADLGSRPHGL